MAVNDTNKGKAERAYRGARVTVMKGGAKSRAVTFGSVTVRGAPPAKTQFAKNVATGRSALERARATIIRGGVKLERSKDVPLYHVDPDQPDEVIRRLDGKVERGRFVNGAFQAET